MVDYSNIREESYRLIMEEFAKVTRKILMLEELASEFGEVESSLNQLYIHRSILFMEADRRDGELDCDNQISGNSYLSL